MKPTRVLSVQHYPVFGGPHNELVRLEPALQRLGIQTIVAHTDQPGNAVGRIGDVVEVHETSLDRLHMTRNPLTHARTLVNGVGDVARLRRMIRELDIDLVKVHGPHNPHGAIAARLEKKPVVWVVSSTRVPKGFRTIGSHLVRRMADAILATGNVVLDAYGPLRRASDRIVTYYPPVDTRLFHPSRQLRQTVRAELNLPQDAPVVGTVANLNPQKGVEYFVRAAARIKAVIPEASFLLVGGTYETQGAYAATIASEIENAGIRDALVMTGARSDVERLYPAMDVKLMTSVPQSEGAPTTVIEAMACAVPVVGTDVGSVRELIHHGENGFVVPPLDVRALAERTTQLLQNAELRQQMGDDARRYAVEHFDVEICAQTHLKAYTLALGLPQEHGLLASNAA